ncbi:MAG: hypothetical protein F4142_00130 [Nitrospira sp. SB0675_bin_23]|nr:hypothetical protein [Nitrospira sp. SB0667_bin_9]MYD30871.1 hypothetical protein [Nitrospira sp. SB0661_bin_20]MYH01007.1 hypothetical protein [Nitrospira sp. SB0675_bin_23]MYJ23422.1 hypothetical protein [Nitrospira sp. SB0673_bin_12]
MYRLGSRKRALGFTGGLVVALLTGGMSWAAIGNGVFQGFLHHIARQIDRDKVDFAVAESCTSWFYEQLKKPVRPDVKRLSFVTEEDRSDACAGRYPGINEARQAFAHSQSTLSLSLTFYQLALVADRDDDEHYDAGELRDIMASLNVAPLPGDDLQLLAKLKRKFDDVREAVEFTILTDSMQVLYNKGYRFTDADQAAMGRVTGES